MADDVTLKLKVTGDASDANRAIESMGDSVDEVGKKFEGLKGKAGALAGGAGVAAGGMFAAGFAANLDIEASNDKLAAQLGLTSAEAATAGQIAGDVYRQNWGASIDEVNVALRAVSTNLGGLGEVSEAELAKMTTSAQALADVYELDVGESTKAAGQLIKNGLAKDATEAFDLIAAGMRDGTDRSGDFLETISEYSPQFAKLGISGSQMLGILQDGLKAGARDTDVIADAFKEFSLRSIDGSKLTAEGFKAAGLNAGEMAAEIAKGGPAAEAATSATLDGLLSIKDPIKQNAAGVALFGTQWEDTLRQILPAIAGMGDASDVVAGSIDQMAAAAGDNAKGKIESLQRGFQGWTQEMTSSDSTMGLVVAGLGTFGGGALAAAGQVGMLAAGLGSMNIMQGIAKVATGVSTAAQWLWNAALSANPIGLVILAIAALVAGLVWFFTKTETGRQVWATAMAAMSAGIATFKTAASTAITWVTTKWDSLMGTLASAKSKVASLGSMFNGMRDGFRSAINFIIRGWNNLRFGIPGFSYAGISVPGFSVGVPQIPFLAAGGIVTKPTLAVIGEAGPEAVVPLSRGMGGIAGLDGGGMTIHVTAGAVGSEDFLARTIRDVVTRTQARGYGY